uniref:Cap-specific mRNA (nucleoside-2'-O-)-methyltransferase 2 n=1 Tax=Strigamia maritima TaxID=126957 RepID=T1IVL2_STRMM
MMETNTDDLTTQHFNKRYYITKTNENWVLPPADELWTGIAWSDETLLSMKDNLNTVKSLLNDKERGPWSEHTQSLNPAGSIVPNLKRRCKPELCTQAWAKCFEIMSNYEIDFFSEFCLNTIHLCEAPGAFITALNHFIYSRWPGKQKDVNSELDFIYINRNMNPILWNWIATTLNPYYEGNSQSCMINDDRFILNTLNNWEFGADNTGDIMHIGNLEKLESRARDLGEISLITADGSIGCHDNPSEQERIVSVLHFCEVVTALTVLKSDGHFVVKMFTFFESRSINLLYLLNCFFREVHLFKPATSKEGNSEIYVICIGYEKDKLKLYENQLKLIFDSSYHEKILLHRKHIPQDFIDHVYTSGKLFAEIQTEVIQRNVHLYQNIDIETRQYYDEMQSKSLTYFMRNFNVNCIDDNHLIVPRKLLLYCFKNDGRKTRSPDLFLRSVDVTFNALQKRKCLSFQEKIFEMNMELHGFMSEKWTPADTVYNEIYLGRDYRPGFESKLDFEFVKYGKPYDKVQSSRFSCQFLINLWNEAVEEIILPNVDVLGNVNQIQLFLRIYNRSKNSGDEQFYNKLYDFNKRKLAQQLHHLFKEIRNKVQLDTNNSLTVN